MMAANNFLCIIFQTITHDHKNNVNTLNLEKTDWFTSALIWSQGKVWSQSKVVEKGRYLEKKLFCHALKKRVLERFAT